MSIQASTNRFAGVVAFKFSGKLAAVFWRIFFRQVEGESARDSCAVVCGQGPESKGRAWPALTARVHVSGIGRGKL